MSEPEHQTLLVRVAGRGLRLTARELALLELLLSAAGKVVSRERILSDVWHVSQDRLTNVFDVLIGRLRKQLRSTERSVTIETLRGPGH